MVGDCDGGDGKRVGKLLGESVGSSTMSMGIEVGCSVGCSVGRSVGLVGCAAGKRVGEVGLRVRGVGEVGVLGDRVGAGAMVRTEHRQYPHSFRTVLEFLPKLTL